MKGFVAGSGPVISLKKGGTTRQIILASSLYTDILVGCKDGFFVL
jgi:hypothetical protein